MKDILRPSLRCLLLVVEHFRVSIKMQSLDAKGVGLCSQSGCVRTWIALPCRCRIFKMAAKREKISKLCAPFKGGKIGYMRLFSLATGFIIFLHCVNVNKVHNNRLFKQNN